MRRVACSTWAVAAEPALSPAPPTAVWSCGSALSRGGPRRSKNWDPGMHTGSLNLFPRRLLCERWVSCSGPAVRLVVHRCQTCVCCCDPSNKPGSVPHIRAPAGVRVSENAGWCKLFCPVLPRFVHVLMLRKQRPAQTLGAA
eukprot:364999-Chlamydomonas_euryale.AAC.13